MDILIKFTLIYALLPLTACQMYRNNGRNMFESTAPGKVTTTGVGLQAQNCWQQPNNIQILDFNPDESYKITPINEQTIEVCIENQISDH